jgi:AcrR family transcriptional regulator
VLGLGQLLVDATAFADDRGDDEPAVTLRASTSALIDTTIANRTAGGLYRWEARYLREDDQRVLAEQIRLVNRRLQRPLAQLRPKLTSRQRWTLSAAALSVIGSITDHSNPLSANEIRSCLTTMVDGVLAAELPATRRRPAITRERLTVGPEAGMYEHVLYEAVRLFYENGYRNTSMEDIASAVGIQASGLYRSFPGKADILALAYRRAADRHSSDTADALGRADDPETVLDELVDDYLGRVIESPDLPYVYYTERHNVPDADLRVLETIEGSTMDAWARLVTAVRPEMKMGAARYAVGAAFALTVDFGRLFHRDPASGSVATIRRLMEVTLLGRPAGRRR